jgi:hypothetical protein
MWRPDKSKLTKARLHSKGEDVETPWAEDCGPAPDPAGARYVRLGNVPFFHAKPTYGDVIVAIPDAESNAYLVWDSEGLPFERIGERIVEDGGRWAMILDFVLNDPTGDAQEAFNVLDRAGEKGDIVVEGCYGPRPGKPGRVYLAVPREMGVDDVMTFLRDQSLPISLTLIHPCDDDRDKAS